jgi:hypothetical protein
MVSERMAVDHENLGQVSPFVQAVRCLNEKRCPGSGEAAAGATTRASPVVYKNSIARKRGRPGVTAVGHLRRLAQVLPARPASGSPRRSTQRAYRRESP